MVLVQSIEAATCRNGYWMFQDETILTHNCFPETIKKLKLLASERVSKLATSLAVALSSDNNPVDIIPLSRSVFAETNYGKKLIDVYFPATSNLRPYRALSADILDADIKRSLEIYESLHPKIGYFFDRATRTDDTFKKFIYYFSVLEIFTNKTYTKISSDVHISYIKKELSIPERIKLSVKRFLLIRK